MGSKKSSEVFTSEPNVDTSLLKRQSRRIETLFNHSNAVVSFNHPHVRSI
jgi:hypothetical protein